MENSALSGSTQDLNTSSAQALQAIINSISPEILSSSRDGEKLTAEQIKKLSDKLEELVGEGGSDGFTQNRNEKGEIVNEDGLPIIEITEPLPNVDTPIPNQPPTTIDEQDLVPLASLSQSERLRLRIERNRILDMLEEEERREQTKGEELNEEQRRELLQKRKDAAKIEVQKLNAAKQLQKKMGKALLRDMADTREREQKMQKPVSTQNTEKKGKVGMKKSVQFADDVPHERSGGKAKAKKADAAASKQGSGNRHVPLSKTRLEKRPMKMDVVERFPAKVAKIQEHKDDQRNPEDESLSHSSVHADSDSGDSIPISRQDNGSPTIEEEEHDLDMAQRQREIALEYYKKRSTIGEHVSKVVISGEGHEWDQPEVPLDATLSSAPPKPAISRFKANCVAAAYNTSAPSTSLGSSVLPAASAQTLQRAVRMGKLEGDQLVGADESASEDENESTREMLELLKRNQVHNIGPESNIRSFGQSSLSVAVDAQTSGHQLPTNPNSSNFKPVVSPPTSRSTSPTTPVSHDERSSPKLPSSPSLVERHILPQSESISSSSPGVLGDRVPESKSMSTTIITSHPLSPYPDANRTSQPDHPSPVMSSVRESTGSTDKNMSQGSSNSQRRVSRFKAERS